MKSLVILCSVVIFSYQFYATKTATVERQNDDVITTTNSPTPNSNATQKSKEKFNIHLKIGIVDGDRDDICFRTKNGNLMENTSVSIITSLYEPPQKVLNARVEKKLDANCSRRASESTDKNPGENFYYSLVLTDKEVDEYQEVFGFGVIEPAEPIKVRHNLASIDLNADGKPEFFRRCSGSEGTLLAIWTGKPLKGKKIWDSFYYVDYDTVPTCTKKDWGKLNLRLIL